MSESEKNSNQLTTITDSRELQQLLDLYRQNWPQHCVGFYCLDNFIHWLQKEPEVKNLKILTLNGDWKSEGLFLIVDRYQLFVHCLNEAEHCENIFKALDLLDWSIGYKVSSFSERQRAAVLKVVQNKHLKIEYDSLTVMYYMPCQEALKLDISCPKEYVLRPLKVEDAETVNNLWPNKHQGSLFVVQRFIQWNVNMGVYTAESNELVAWCLRLQGGFLGALQVKDSHKRHGLGSLVTRATSRRIAETGDDIMALVNATNVPSCGMFNKVGFKVKENCYWLRTYPTIENYKWPEGE